MVKILANNRIIAYMSKWRRKRNGLSDKEARKFWNEFFKPMCPECGSTNIEIADGKFYRCNDCLELSEEAISDGDHAAKARREQEDERW